MSTVCPICHVVFPAQCRDSRGEKLLNITGRHVVRSCPKHPHWSGMSDNCLFCKREEAAS